MQTQITTKKNIIHQIVIEAGEKEKGQIVTTDILACVQAVNQKQTGAEGQLIHIKPNHMHACYE